MSKTRYIIVGSESLTNSGDTVADLLDEGYTLLISWVAGIYVHHILTKED